MSSRDAPPHVPALASRMAGVLTPWVASNPRVRAREAILSLHADLGRPIDAGEEGELISRYMPDWGYAVSARVIVRWDREPDVEYDCPARFIEVLSRG